jgi:hypothetical protein
MLSDGKILSSPKDNSYIYQFTATINGQDYFYYEKINIPYWKKLDDNDILQINKIKPFIKARALDAYQELL